MKKVGLLFLLILTISLVPDIQAAPIEIKYFYSSGCSHCRNVTGILDQIEEDYGDLVNIERINIYLLQNQQIWEDYSIRFSINGVPAIVINEERKLEGDIKIKYSSIVAIIDELMEGIEVYGDDLYSQGVSAMNNGEFDLAIINFNDAIDIYEAANNDDKVSLAQQRIIDCNNYIQAQELFIQAEDLYHDEDYASAKELYEQIIDLYAQIGNETMASTSEARLTSCNFFINYELATESFENDQWQNALDYYASAKEFTSKKETIDAINELMSFCESQLTAEDLYEQGETAFELNNYANAKQLYSDASMIFSDMEKIQFCNDKINLCEQHIQANDTFDYGVLLYGQADYNLSITTFESAKQLYSDLNEQSLAENCDSYIALAQDKLDEIEKQRLLEEEKRRHDRQMKILYVAGGISAVVAGALIFFFHRRKSVALDESEHASEYEEDEGETQ